MGVPNAMNRAFNRLRWSVFDPPSTILVVDSPATPNSPLVPFVGHPITTQPATDIPLREIPFYITPLTEWEHPDYERPAALIVRREDGGVVTVGDVVSQLSDHLIKYKGDIIEATHLSLCWKTEVKEDGTAVAGLSNTHEDPVTGAYEIDFDAGRAFFSGFGGHLDEGDEDVYVEVWVEGQYGEGFEGFWRERLEFMGLVEEEAREAGCV